MSLIRLVVILVAAAGLPILYAQERPVPDQATWTFDRPDPIGGVATRVEGNPTVVDTPLGKAIEFDGVDDALWVEQHPLAGAERFEGVSRRNRFPSGLICQRWLSLVEFATTGASNSAVQSARFSLVSGSRHEVRGSVDSTHAQGLRPFHFTR